MCLAKSILKKCLRISLRLSSGPALTRKLLDSDAALKNTNQDLIARLMQGLIIGDIKGLDYPNLKLRYNFLA